MMNVIDIADTFMQRLARYHDHRVEGLDHIPSSGPGLIVVNHSLATSKPLLMTADTAPTLQSTNMRSRYFRSRSISPLTMYT